MKLTITLFLLLLIGATSARAEVCEEWNDLFAQIRDFKISKEAAKAAFAPLHRRLQETYGHQGIGGAERVYPVVGYNSRWGEKGAAYKPRGYQFFSGNREGIHPSLDLFVLDRDQDSLDDRSQQPVPIVAYSGGVVVGVNTEWDFPSPQRGGKYVWLFDPSTNRYSYYAHLSQVEVKLGEIVPAGARLGLLGRTGLNAYKKRSPTHLHLTVLTYCQGEMVPFNPWLELSSLGLETRRTSSVAPKGE